MARNGELNEDYMTEIDYSDASDASGVGAIDKALPGKMHDSFKDATGARKSTSLSIIVRPESYRFEAESENQCQRVSSADQKVFALRKCFGTCLLMTIEFPGNYRTRVRTSITLVTN